MCTPLAAGAATFASGAIGAVGQHSSQQSAYNDQVANVARQNAQIAKEWDYTLKERDRDWTSQLAIWNAKRAEYGQTLEQNASAADRAYASEQLRLNDMYSSAAFGQQAMLEQLMQSRGGNLASGQSGRSVGKMDQAMLAAFGRNNATIAQNLSNSRNAMIRANDNTRQDLNAANMRAWRQVQFAPQPTTAPVKPMYMNNPTNPGSTGLMIGLAQAGLSGFNAFSSMKAPSGYNGGGGGSGGGTNWNTNTFGISPLSNNPYTFR